MKPESRVMMTTALIVALGGFLMGFDASVISGVVGFIETEFGLSKIEQGWAVSSLALTASAGMLVSGPLSDRVGRRPVLMMAAVLFAVSAVASAIAPTFTLFIIARMIGGLGVGAALIVAPMYIAEIAPAAERGRLVSFNQFNIVIGISTAFFSNYLILELGQSGAAWVADWRLDVWNWRWMLGVEALPAVLYFLALFTVPESPRWLAMRGREAEALQALSRVNEPEQAERELQAVMEGIAAEAELGSTPVKALFQPALRFALTIGISIAILQQITGINSVFFYAPIIFEQSGIGTNAAFMQAILVGLVNVVFTVLAMALIDRLGRRFLLGIGLSGMSLSMLILAWGFGTATYSLDPADLDALPAALSVAQLDPVLSQEFGSDREFREAVASVIGEDVYLQHESPLIRQAISIDARVILLAILGFVASFAISLGPVMWVLFSELFPNRIRGVAVSTVGLINSITAFLVTLVFPWQLHNMGSAATFLTYGVFALIGLVFVLRRFPETKGRSLEELERVLVFD